MELLERAQAMHGEAQALEERINFLQQQIVELVDFEKGLHALENNEHKEIFASLGKGVFVPAKIESKEMLVEVGSGVIVKKNAGQVLEVIKEQIDRLENLRSDAQENLSSLQEEFAVLFEQIKGIKQ